MDEIWKAVPSYEGLYEVSDKGRVRTVEGKTTYSVLHGERHWKSRILKTKDTWAKNHSVWCGWRVTLWKDKEPKDYLVHRLEACAFLGYPLDSELTVNHKDGDRTNNDISNLEMISRADNIKHGFNTGLYRSIQVPVELEDEQGNTMEFPSLSEMNRFLGRSIRYRPYKPTVKSKDGTIYTITRYGS